MSEGQAQHTASPAAAPAAAGGELHGVPDYLLLRLIEQSQDLLALVTPLGVYEYVSPSVERILGYAAGELVGRSALEIVAAEDRPVVVEALSRVTRQGADPYYVEFTAIARDGARRRLEAIGSALPWRDGELRVVVNARDVTERVEAVARLRQSEERFRGLVTSMNDVAVVLDAEQRYVGVYGGEADATASLRRKLGRTPQDVLGEELGAAHMSAGARALAGERVVYEWSLEPDGRRMQSSLAPLRSEDGTITGLVGVTRDISPLRTAEQAAESAVAMLSAVIEASPFGLAVLDLEGRVRLWNPAAEQLTGWPESEVIGRPCPSVPPSAWGDVRAQLAAVLGGEVQHTQGERWRRDGSEFQARVALAPIWGEGGSVERVLAVIEDITEQLEVQERVHRRDAILQVLSTLARRLLWNASLGDGFDQALAEVGRAAEASRARLMQRITGEDGRDRLACYWEWCGAGVDSQIGNPMVQLVDVDAPGIAEWQGRLEAGQPVAGVVAELTPAQQAILVPQGILSVAMAPITVEGKLWGVVGFDDCEVERRWSPAELDALRAVAELLGAAIHRERVEAELRQAKEQAEAANVAKSDFLARMSHELRTPLTSVIGFTNVLRKRLAPEFAEEEYMLLRRISANAVHLLSLINDLLDISKVEAGKLAVVNAAVDVGALVRETVEQYAAADGPVQLQLCLPEAVRPIVSDPAKLRQVILNLVGNAFKFTEWGTVTVTLETDDAGRPAAVHVTDTGIGIAPERLAGIFDAFEQADAGTSRRYGGTGLGLTISRALCQLMGHTLSAASRPGQGSTFTVRFGPDAGAEGARVDAG